MTDYEIDEALEAGWNGHRPTDYRDPDWWNLFYWAEMMDYEAHRCRNQTMNAWPPSSEWGDVTVLDWRK